MHCVKLNQEARVAHQKYSGLFRQTTVFIIHICKAFKIDGSYVGQGVCIVTIVSLKERLFLEFIPFDLK